MNVCPIDTKTLTDDEVSLLDLTGNVAVRFTALAQVHPADCQDVTFHVHAIQNIILARAAYSREARRS